MFFNNSSPGGTFAVGFIPQNFTGHNQFLKNTGAGLRVYALNYIQLDTYKSDPYSFMHRVWEHR